jgi:hypothetical protein
VGIVCARRWYRGRAGPARRSTAACCSALAKRRPSSVSSGDPDADRRLRHWCGSGAIVAADLPLFAVGLALAFFSALVCIRWLIRYVSTHDFTVFAWYRIAFGVVILLTAHMGWVDWVR